MSAALSVVLGDVFDVIDDFALGLITLITAVGSPPIGKMSPPTSPPILGTAGGKTDQKNRSQDQSFHFD